MAKNKTNTAPSTTPRGQRAPKGVLWRLLKTLFEFYPVLLPITLVCILINAIVSSVPSVFMQNIIALVDSSYKSGDWSSVSGQILTFVGILITMYIISLIAGFCYTQLMAIITQGSLKKLREKMFDHMEDLPIRYFDTNGHGDIMSYYTNDVDTLRQMISQSLPQMLISGVTLLTVFCIMMYYSMILGLIVVAGIVCMTFAARYVTSHSSKYFLRQQVTLAKAEAFMEEMMTGQKVIKVFCHEDETRADFDKVNDEIFFNARNGNRFANILMPLLSNIGNVMYVVVALVGGALLLTDVPNISVSGMAFSISIVVPFLNMTRQFAGAVGQVSNQVNMVIMGSAGAHRIFALLDEEPETDDGYVTLVNAKENADGTLTECEERTNVWAWKHPHHDGTLTYTKLQGDVRFYDVNFGYTPEKTVLHNVSLYAKPGQKLAFVGSTGAGKTTITNLINRFYDINDGKIRYDGININKIKKADLRRSLGIVLQDTNLFTGTVMENIRYGNLDACDEECIAAAKLAGADDFIRRLPEGYNTMLFGNGSNLSQGQRQLLAIARAAVADPPVMIMDEATSSIDTRTEAIVQRGMDALMTGRTVFVTHHRARHPRGPAQAQRYLLSAVYRSAGARLIQNKNAPEPNWLGGSFYDWVQLSGARRWSNL